VNDTQQLFDLVAVALVAALTPLVVAALPGPRVPQVVIFLLGGILMFLTNRGHFVALASVAAVGLLAIVLSVVPWLGRSRAVRRIIKEGQDATGQITLRWAVVLLFLLIAVASKFGLDIVLGAVLAGMVVRIWTRRLSMDAASLERKFDAVGYGIFIPIFFISSGMSIDLKAIGQDPLRLLLLLAMLLIVRGLPSLIVYRRVLPVRQRAEMTFITATSLPLLIARAEIGQQDGVMLPATAAALVGAGVLSVLIFPLVAVVLHRSAPLTRPAAGIQSDPAPEEAPRSVPDNGQLPDWPEGMAAGRAARIAPNGPGLG
jgi:Kef-type K+ transport system membrane component KefB